MTARPQAMAMLAGILLALPCLAYAQDMTKLKREYPRLGGVQISAAGWKETGGYASPRYVAEMAKLDVLICGCGDNSNSAKAVARSIKSINSSTFIAKYTNFYQARPNTSPGNYHYGLYRKLTSETGPNPPLHPDWVMRTSDGRETSRWDGTIAGNPTIHVRPDSNGDRLPQWAAKYSYDFFYNESDFDFFYFDSANWWQKTPKKTAINPDRDPGVADGRQGLGSTTRDRQFRESMRAHWEAVRAIDSSLPIMPNTADWPLASTPIPEYENQVRGGLLETFLTDGSNGYRQTRTFAQAMEQFEYMQSILLQPSFLIIDVKGRPDNYQFFRYTFTLSLMGSAYFDYNITGRSAEGFGYFSINTWFDEYDLAGNATTSWMGNAISEEFPEPGPEGVYVREFENALAILNPPGNGSRTINVGPGWKRIKGNQASNINDGRESSSVTLNDADGIILQRIGAAPAGPPPITNVANPKPPVLGIQ